MNELSSMVWVEARKAWRSRMPLWTALASLFFPLGMAFLIFVSRNPEISKKLGLISAKADLVAFSGADWAAFLNFASQMTAIGGLMLLTFIISWVFGREFADGTLKDLLAVPVRRSSILLAKYIVTWIWSLGLTGVILSTTLLMGTRLGLPGGTSAVILRQSGVLLLAACMTLPTCAPFALFAGLGRGYLLPISVAVLTLMMTNLMMVLGWAEFFPWAIPGLYAQGETALAPVSYWIVALTGLAGVLVTMLWWQYADQNK